MRGPLEPGADHAAQSSREIEALVIESRFGRGDVALRQVESMLPAFEQRDDATMLLHALYARALIVRRLGSPAEDSLDACDVLEDAARTRGFALWAAVACALRAQSRVDEGDVVAATADLARADIDLSPVDLASPVAFRLLDALAVVYARLRLHDRLDDVRERIESTVNARSPLERAIHWAGWCSELAVRAMEPVAMGEGAPATQSLRSAVEIGARIDSLPPAAVPPPLRRGVSAVRALAAAYRGRPSEALRILGQDAFGEARQLPPVERQIATLAAMRAHAHVGSIASARSLDDAAGQTKSTLVHLVLSVCRARERLWLETHAGGQVVPVLNRLVELLVRLGWHGMDMVADIARQSMEHHALREESRTDALTGVGNRRALDEELRQLVRFSQLPLSLVLIDVDDFKSVNDRFTHVVGDEVLRQVALSLSEQLRGGDRLLRFGGDEFVALLPATGDQEAHRVAARMSRAIEAVDWAELSSGLQVTVTTGSAALWSLTERRPDADAERLFQRADEALLSAKRRRSGSSGTRVAARAASGSRSASGRGSGGRATPDQTPGSGLDVRSLSGGSGQERDVDARYELGSPLQESRAAQAPGFGPPPPAARVPAPSAPSTPISTPMPVASLFNEPTSFVQPAPVPQHTAGQPAATSAAEHSPYGSPAPGLPAALPAASVSPPTVPSGHPASNGYNTNSYNPSSFQANGYNANGYNANTYDPNPYNANPYNANTYDANPYDANGHSPTGHGGTSPVVPSQPGPLPQAPHQPRAWEPGWQPEWAANAPRRDPLTDPLTGPLMEPLLDPLLDPASGRHSPAAPPDRERGRRAIAAGPHAGSEFVDPDTDALEVIDLTSGLARRRRDGGAAPGAREETPPTGVAPPATHASNGLPPIGFPPNGFPPNGLPPIGFPPSDARATDVRATDVRATDARANDTPANDARANDTRANGTRANGTRANGPTVVGPPSNGLPPIGFPPSGSAQNGAVPGAPRVTAPAPNGLPPIGFPPGGPVAHGRPSNEHAPNGRPSSGSSSNGYSSNGYSSNGLPPIGFPPSGPPSPAQGYPPVRPNHGPADHGPADHDDADHDDAEHRAEYGLADPYRRPTPDQRPSVIDLTGHGRRRNRERLRSSDSDEPR